MKATIYWIDGPWKGRLGIAARPRGGDWLEDEVRSWVAAGVNVVVSTLCDDEMTDFDLANEGEFCRANGIEYIPFPIADRGVPSSQTLTANLIRELERSLTAGKNVAVHCRQGIGRSALLTACVLAWSGMAPDLAFERIRKTRGCPVPDTVEQQEWVAKFVREAGVALVHN